MRGEVVSLCLFVLFQKHEIKGLFIYLSILWTVLKWQ